MAIWQIDFMIVPSKNATMDANLEDFFLWNNELLEDFKRNIKKSWSPEESWSKNIEQYGKLDETCMELMGDEKNMVEISVRLDLRSLSKAELKFILSETKAIDGIIFYNEQVYEADLAIALDLLRNSPAAQFCENPKEFFKNLD